MNKFYIDPKCPEPHLLSQYPKLGEVKKAGRFYENVEILMDSLRDPNQIPTSTAGRVSNGLPDARGFINTETSLQRSQNQHLEQDAIDQWNASREHLENLDKQRRTLVSERLYSEEPEIWQSMSHLQHGPVLQSRIIDNGENQYVKAKPKGLHQIDNPYIKSLNKNISSTADNILQYQQRDAAIQDTEALKNNLEIERNSGVVFCRNGNSVRVDSHPIPHKKTGAFINLQTSNSSYGKFDSSFYREPEQFPTATFTEDETSVISRKNTRAAYRNSGMYATEHRDQFHERTVDMDENYRKHNKSHYFEKKHNTMQMLHGNNPTLKPTNFQNTLSSADVNPEAFTTSNMRMNSHFKQY